MDTKGKHNETKFEDMFSHAFHNYGMFVARHPKAILWFTIILTCCSLPGFAFLRLNLDLYKLFVPPDAPVKYEFERAKEFSKLPNQNIDNWIKKKISEKDVNFVEKNNTTSIDVNIKKKKNLKMHNDILRFYIVHKNYENLFESKTLIELYNYTEEMMKITMEKDGYTWSLEDFCKKDPGEKHCTNLLNIWLKHAANLFKHGSSRTNPNLQLSYPVMYLFNRPRDIGNIIYGVDVQGEKNEIIGAKVLTIHWFAEFPNNGTLIRAFFDYRQRLKQFWDEKSKNSNLDFVPHNDKAMDDELRLIIETALPYAIPCSIQLMLFVVLSNLSKDPIKSKPMEAYFGVISVILALICSFGFCFACGISFNPVSCTMPFLLLAIGIDDDFLILGAWRMANPKSSIEERMGWTMDDAGASITVTSLTNFGCFALGYFLSPTPAVGDFCILTAVGVLFDYIFQITFFSALIVIGAKREKYGGLNSYFPWGTKPPVEGEDKPNMELENGNDNSVVSVKDSHKVQNHSDNAVKNATLMARFMGEKFAPFILRRDVKIISYIFFILYLILSFYGCIHMKVDISPKKYIRDTSVMQFFIHLADKYIWADNVQPIFHVMNPPDFRNASQRARFNELIFRLEHTKYSIGRVSTNFWLWQYQQFLNDFPEVDYQRDFYDRKYLSIFLNTMDYSEYKGKLKINSTVPNGEPCISAFTFATSFFGLNSWDKRQSELFFWRDILKEYPEFDMFLAGIFSPFLIDQRFTIAPSSMQSIGSAVAVMALLSILFLPDKQSAFIIAFSITSISLGVCGFLQLWGSDLDSVSMGCIIMAIGLAVDFSVHICYKYHRSLEITADEKVIDTLSIVGYPIIQAITSTLWSMLSVYFIEAYLVRVFFQTVVLVNVFGALHALVWLPQVLSMLDPCNRIPLRFKED
uniref:SSD domain-containing protein n=1 Tax=Parastrongyloides trichosuri TaxID=131310 RepID=A0A0N4ZRU5_PARTI